MIELDAEPAPSTASSTPAAIHERLQGTLSYSRWLARPSLACLTTPLPHARIQDGHGPAMVLHELPPATTRANPRRHAMPSRCDAFRSARPPTRMHARSRAARRRFRTIEFPGSTSEPTKPPRCPATVAPHATAAPRNVANELPRGTREPSGTCPPLLRSGSSPGAAPGPPSGRLPEDRYRPVNAALDIARGPWHGARCSFLGAGAPPCRPVSPARPPVVHARTRARLWAHARKCTNEFLGWHDRTRESGPYQGLDL